MAKQQNRSTRGGITANDVIAQQAALGGKMPPQAVEVEEAVLGALLVEQDAFQIVSEILKPEHFYKHQHSLIYAAMERLNIKNSPTDILLVTEELRRTGELEEAGNMIYLAQLSEKVASAVNVEFHARIIFQKYMQRSLISLGTDMQTNAYDDGIDVDDLLEDAENKLFNMTQGSMKKDVQQIAPVISEAVNQMYESAKRKDSLSGIPSGFFTIDKVTSGWQASTLVIIAARPAMGKTAFVLSMARKMALNHNIPIAMFSLEMSNVELVKRLMVGQTEIESNKIKSGRLTSEEWKIFDARVNPLISAPIYIDDTPGLSVFDLRSKARILKKKHDIKCIIIDYLQLMTASAMRPGNR
ncbi:MAG: replicative DNA helicase, partial [Bacteroidales bacterium]|nr:replicative DNA helicase [Bacteroidales bacterium]